MSEGQYTKIRVHNPKGKDLRFEGIKLTEGAAVEIGTIEIFKTKGGKRVASQRDNRMSPEPRLFRLDVLNNSEDLIEWLGYSKSAKEIAEKLGLSVSVWID